MASFLIFEPQLPAHDFGLFVVPSAGTWCRSISLNHNWSLTISASSLCHQGVRGVVLDLWTTTPGSQFRPLVVPSVCTWRRSRSLNHNCWLTISASGCAIRKYVASFYIFEPQPLAHDFALFVVPSVCTWRRSISLNHNRWLTISASSLCHQPVRGIILDLWTTTTGSRFLVPSVCKWRRSRSLNHDRWLTISASSLCHQTVRGVVKDLRSTADVSRFRPYVCAISMYVASF